MPAHMSQVNDVKSYWESRAQSAGGEPTATTNDVYLRELEARTLVAKLKPLQERGIRKLTDLGCGDGLTTLRLAEQLPGLQMRGIDYSENMVRQALARRDSRPDLAARVDFSIGDARNFAGQVEPGTLDAVTTDRCLINLATSDEQYTVIEQIHASLRPGGVYLAIENFVEGQEALNTQRKALGLPEVSIRWHNVFFSQAEFTKRASRLFAEVTIEDFSSAYYYATRVIYSRYCQMRKEEPDYHHEIHRLAIDLPPHGAFSPIKLAILRK